MLNNLPKVIQLMVMDTGSKLGQAGSRAQPCLDHDTMLAFSQLPREVVSEVKGGVSERESSIMSKALEKFR